MTALDLNGYTEIGQLNEKHRVSLVKHNETGTVYVKKVLTSFESGVIKYLAEEPRTGIPEIIGYCEQGGEIVLIEEYIDGSNLEGEILSEKAATDVIISLCRILAGLHKAGIVHRDIKPGNVMVTGNGDVYLIDFDASKSVDSTKKRDTTLMGTEGYAAPEQYGFRSSDPRTDIYALGVLLCRLVTGRFPNEEGGTDGISAHLKRVIAKCTAMEPSDRYQNVSELERGIGPKMTDRRLPGFRNTRVGVKIGAGLWYTFILVLSFVTPADPGDISVPEWLLDVTVFLLLFLPTLYLGDYMGIKERMPWSEKGGLFSSVAGTAAIIGIVVAVYIVLGLILQASEL